MAYTAARQTQQQPQEHQQGQNGEPVSCFLIITEICDTGRESPNEQTIAQTDAKCRRKLKTIFLGLGFTCIVVCFIFAALGYMKFRSCPPDVKCEKDPEKFSQAQNYRLGAALLFIVGICLIIGFIWLVKRENSTQEFVLRQDVLVSDVTAEGLMKTPAPELPHPLSQVHNLVYEIPADEFETKQSTSDLPHYESAMKLSSEGKSSVNPDGEIITIKGVEMESVSTQVDEDDIIPPPTYLQAIEIEIESPENEPQTEERDNG